MAIDNNVVRSLDFNDVVDIFVQSLKHVHVKQFSEL